MIEEPKVAVYTATANLYDAMWSSAKSFLATGCVDEVHLLIEDDEFPYDTGPLPVYFKNVSKQRYFHPDGPNMNSRFTYMAMMRAALAFEFPYLNRILSLDCDTYAQKNVRELWNIDLDEEECCLAACIEPGRSKPSKTLRYTNIGVCMYNLNLLRWTNKAIEAIWTLNRRSFAYLDQDVMNFLCQGRIYELPPEFNSCKWVEKHDYSKAKIKHYAGEKEWMHLDIPKAWLDMPVEQVVEMRVKNMGGRANAGLIEPRKKNTPL